MKAVLLFAIFILFCPAAFAQGDVPPVPAVEDLYLAKDDGNGKAGEQVSEFRTSDVPIYCVVMLDTPAKVTVKMNFVAVSVTGVKAETKVVTASYTTKDGQNRVNFTGRPEGKWTPGKYRVDIYIDGKTAKNIEFLIKGSGGDTTAGKYFSPPETQKPAPPKRQKRP
ncbi:MAG: hypothetical protein ACKVQJ_05780 [Pyrinomonadaceae bacterium]